MIDSENSMPSGPRWLHVLCWCLIGAFFVVRLFHLSADFTHEEKYSGDGVLFTDEGWYANNALSLYRLGNWHREGELNFAVNLPVLQAMHVASFAVFGPTIKGARMTVVFCFAVTLLFLFLLVREFAGYWPAMLAVFWCVSNYFLFLYSRFAIADMPMAMFVTAALFVAARARGERAYYFAAGAGALLAVAMLTKTSAAVGVPLVFAALVLRGESNKTRAISSAIAAGVFVVTMGLHWLLLARSYPVDYAYFNTLNFQANARLSPSVIFANFLYQLDHVQLVDRVLYQLLRITIPLLLIFSSRFRRNPLVWFGLAWIAIYLLMLAVYNNNRPRYWSALAVPSAALLAAAFQAIMLEIDWQKKPQIIREKVFAVALIGFSLVFIAGLIRNISDFTKYFSNIEYTFAEMARDIRETMEKDPNNNGVLLGHFSTTIALYEPLIPVNDRFAPSTLDERIEEYHPRYLVTESLREERDFANQWATITAAEGGVRDAALRAHFADVELVKAYDTFGNYKDWTVAVGFYRLIPPAE